MVKKIIRDEPDTTASAAVLASLKEFVELYSGTRHMLGDTVRRKLERAEAAIAKAEGGQS